MLNSSRLRLNRRACGLALAAASSLALAACSGNKEPKGQVVATVDGDEITRRDLAAELQASGAQQLTNVAAVQPLVVNKIVSRKLLVEQAKKDGLDKTPEYLAGEQRLREVLLASMVADRWASQIAAPSDEQVQAYIQSHPWMFGQRRILTVDQIRTTPGGLDPNALKPLTNNDQVAAYLTQQKHAFQRTTTSVDSLTLPEDVARKVLGMAPGMPFATVEGGVLLVNSITGSKDAPVPAARQADLARAAMKRQSGEKAVENQLASMRNSAKISYQPGFAPPAAKGAAAH